MCSQCLVGSLFLNFINQLLLILLCLDQFCFHSKHLNIEPLSQSAQDIILTFSYGKPNFREDPLSSVASPPSAILLHCCLSPWRWIRGVQLQIPEIFLAKESHPGREKNEVVTCFPRVGHNNMKTCQIGYNPIQKKPCKVFLLFCPLLHWNVVHR